MSKDRREEEKEDKKKLSQPHNYKSKGSSWTSCKPCYVPSCPLESEKKFKRSCDAHSARQRGHAWRSNRTVSRFLPMSVKLCTPIYPWGSNLRLSAIKERSWDNGAALAGPAYLPCGNVNSLIFGHAKGWETMATFVSPFRLRLFP